MQRRKWGTGVVGQAPPTVGAGAIVAFVQFKGCRTHNGMRHVELTKDVLVFARSPGDAEDTVLLSGAVVEVSACEVRVKPRHAAPLTLRLSTEEEAQRWAAELRDAAQLASRVHLRSAASVSQVQRAHGERVAQLEARVSATLHAAMARTHRINELEAVVAQGKARETRIRELEVAVEATAREAIQRAERVRELENALLDKGVNPADCASAALLEDTMRLAEQVLGSREEVVLDGGTVQGIREAVEEVRRKRPAVTEPVADLVGKLVTGLRWPLALRDRLARAEDTIKEQKAVQNATESELRELITKHDAESTKRMSAETEVAALKGQLAIAETAAMDAVDRLKCLEAETRVEEMRMLRDQRNVDAEKLKDAESEASELRRRLEDADRFAVEAQERQRELHDDAREEALHVQAADLQQERLEAEAEAKALRERLGDAEAALDEAVDRQQISEKAYREELQELKQSCATAQEQRARIAVESEGIDEALRSGEGGDASELALLREQRAETESKLRGAESRARELEHLLAEAEESLDLNSDRGRAELQERHQQEMLALHAEAVEAVQLKDQAAEEARRYSQMVETATQQRDELHEKHRTVEDSLRFMKDRHNTAEAERDLARQQTQELRRRLVDAEQGASKSKEDQRRALKEGSHEEDLRDTHAEQQDIQLQDLHNMCADAERQREEAEEQVRRLRSDLVVAQQDAQEALRRREDDLSQAHGEEVAKLAQQQRDANLKRERAEELLAAAQVAVRTAAQNEKERLEQVHWAEVNNLREQQAAAEKKAKLAESETKSLRRNLDAAKKAADDANAEQKTKLEAASRDQINNLQKSKAMSESKVHHYEEQVRSLTKRVTDAEAEAKDAQAKRKHLMDMQSTREAARDAELKKLQRRHNDAETKRVQAEDRVADLKRRVQNMEGAGDDPSAPEIGEEEASSTIANETASASTRLSNSSVRWLNVKSSGNGVSSEDVQATVQEKKKLLDERLQNAERIIFEGRMPTEPDATFDLVSGSCQLPQGVASEDSSRSSRTAATHTPMSPKPVEPQVASARGPKIWASASNKDLSRRQASAANSTAAATAPAPTAFAGGSLRVPPSATPSFTVLAPLLGRPGLPTSLLRPQQGQAQGQQPHPPLVPSSQRAQPAIPGTSLPVAGTNVSMPVGTHSGASVPRTFAQVAPLGVQSAQVRPPPAPVPAPPRR